ncbi:MAG: ABC transporter ATP-binding protein [Candidatus Bathyarchaeia archaeon]|nr:ABC transporter ATP-binding protein [Candidatus Bathyarchaeota archaeon]
MRVAVRVNGLTKRFGDKTAVDKVSFNVGFGEVYGLLGPNGAGKSTLISMIAGVIEPDEGTIEVLGGEVRDSEIRAKINYCPQNPALYDDLTGLENLIFYSSLYGITGRRALEKARELIKRVGLEGYANKPVKIYSGGMKKRLNLAAALMNEPRLLILDEPTTGMDPQMRREVWQLLSEIKDSDRAIIISTHYMDEAEALSDRVAIMDSGRIIAEGKTEDLKRSYASKSVISIEFFNPDDQQKAREALCRYLEPRDIVAINGSIRVYSEDPDTLLPQISLDLFKVGVKIASIRVVKPTLEDVFLRLTGRRIMEVEG